jgi:hypothetical protein
MTRYVTSLSELLISFNEWVIAGGRGDGGGGVF